MRDLSSNFVEGGSKRGNRTVRHRRAGLFPLLQRVEFLDTLKRGPGPRFYPYYRQMEMITGTNSEQIMPLSTERTTVSSLVYFSIMGRVVSSLVAPAGAMLV